MQESYTAANALPYKLASDPTVISRVQTGLIPPKHVQFIPTNRCNLRCSFCSCAKRDTSLVMEPVEIYEMVRHLAEVGTEAVTITGGGEPLLHPDFDFIVRTFREHDIQVGLVTNGTCLDLPDTLDLLTWCRISAADERDLDGFSDKVLRAVERAPDVGWAFSYVLSPQANAENLAKHFRLAEQLDFTHVRVVADLLHPGDVVMARDVADSPLAIWQPRTSWAPGIPDCRISLLKPVIGPDGKVYPCCGVQYARDDMDLDLPDDFVMGTWRDIGQMKAFDGSVCKRCYYDDYNSLLRAMSEGLDHSAFL